MKTFSEAIYEFVKEYPNTTTADLQSFTMGWKSAKEVTFEEVEEHLNKWFGTDWSDQSSTQILSMVMDLFKIK